MCLSLLIAAPGDSQFDWPPVRETSSPCVSTRVCVYVCVCVWERVSKRVHLYLQDAITKSHLVVEILYIFDEKQWTEINPFQEIHHKQELAGKVMKDRSVVYSTGVAAVSLGAPRLSGIFAHGQSRHEAIHQERDPLFNNAKPMFSWVLNGSGEFIEKHWCVQYRSRPILHSETAHYRSKTDQV